VEIFQQWPFQPNLSFNGMKRGTLETSPRVTPNLDAYKLLFGEGYELIHLTLRPGQTQSKHANPFRVVFYILDGQGTLLTESESLDLSKDMFAEVEPDILRSWENKHDSPLKLLVIKLLV
jgi:quercetin dioxygenase-like cupin family protein